MIEKNNQCGDYKEYIVTCDGCGEELSFGVNEWNDLMRMIKEEGWVTTHIKDGYEHHCKDCQ
jgi:hypothetical protein